MLLKQHVLQLFNNNVDYVVITKTRRFIFHELYFQAHHNSICDNQFKSVLENSCFFFY